MAALAARGGVIFTNLVSFTGVGGAFPGGKPLCGLVVGEDGNLYGTTSTGGAYDKGTVFRLTPGGDYALLFSFNGTNGANPKAALTPAGKGIFYGTTYAGGVSNWGTIFLITTNGDFTNLFSFTGTNHPWQGAAPESALVPDGDGGFFGTADFGGTTNTVSTAGTLQGYGYGTVFEWSTNGTVTAPVVFGGTNGIHPSGGLVCAKDGNFYGTTTWGGPNLGGSVPGNGTVFRLNSDGTLTDIYQFTGIGDGAFIYAGLALGEGGDLYGAAFFGGTNNYGTLFRINTNGDFEGLHTFNSSERGTPYTGMMRANDGNFYGTTYGLYFGGSGTVFRLTPGGAFTNLFFFNGANGSSPSGVLVQGPDNNLYGTTASGGASGLGTIFRLSVPMPAVFKSTTLTNGMAAFTWGVVAGQAYQLQSSTNLATTNWTDMGKRIFPTNGLVTTTAATAADGPQRFYRLVLHP